MRRLAVVAILLLAGAWAPGAAGEPVREGRVAILAPRGGQTDERVVAIRGTVEGVPGDRVTLVLNGVALSVPVEGGAFQTTQVLAPGWNAIRVVAEGEGVRAEDAVALFARVPRKDLRVALTWDTAGTDVDLWVTGPDGEKVFYSNKQGRAGGTLDVDVTTGFGPETYTQARVTPGTWRIQAHYYSGSVPTRVTVTVVRAEGTPEEERTVFRGTLALRDEVLEVGEFVLP